MTGERLTDWVAAGRAWRHVVQASCCPSQDLAGRPGDVQDRDRIFSGPSKGRL